MKLIKTILILLVICAVFGAAMFGINFYTAPIIEANNAGAELAPLLAVMPEGASFGADALVYDASNTAGTTLVNVPESVLSVYKEANGLGYVIRCTAVSTYSESPMEITIGIDKEGKICGIQLDSYSDSVDFRDNDANYLTSYIGKDSALADVGTVSGATYSSTAFKGSVEAAMGVLIENNLIAAGVKSDDQILEELIPTVAPGFTKLVEANVSGNIQKALKAENDTGFAYIMTEGDATYLAVVNAMGICKIYDVEGADVTAAHTALADEAKTASAAQVSYSDALITKVGKMMDGASDITALELDTFNTVVAAVSFKVGDATYYGFYSRSIGFHQMDVYIVIDENGAIAKIDAKQFIFEEEYFMAFGGMNVGEYKDGFVGITGETWTGDQAIIATATMTSNAMKESTTDAFASFNSIKGGEQ
ncbi:MAG: FMN-binding protein [Clostridia bacterium]|nr:FMN-binding protein [Clostridia bacterium]MBQ9751070.1 FMN-binding protein [Clostridia bacterium]